MVNALAGLADGARLSQGFQDTYDTSRLNMLAGKAYTAPQEQRQSLLGQMAAVDPQAAQAQQQQWQGDEDRQTKLLVNGARYMKGALDSKNPSAVAGAWKSVRPALIRAGMATEQELSPEWDPSYEQTVHQLLAMGGPDVNGATPTDVRSFQMMTAGLSPEDQMRARRVNLGLDGRASGAAIGYQKVKGADGIERLVAVDPRQIGAQVVGDGAGYGSFAGLAENSPPVDGGGLDFASDAQQFASLGIPVSSTMRSGDKNREVGGVANSYHLTGEAIDVAPQSAEQKQQAQQYWRSRGYQVIDEGDHLHIEPPRRGMTTSRLQGGANPFAGRRPEDEAAATERAKLQAQQDFLPTELGMRTQADIEKTRGVEQAKSDQERAAAAPGAIATMQASLNSIDELLDSPDLGSIVGLGSMNPLNRIPGTDARGLIARADQISGQAFLAAFNQLKGGGAITEREGAAATAAMARLDRSQSLADYKAALTDLKDAITPAMERQRAALRGQQIQPAGRSIVRTGTSNGRKVIQYSDGSVEYGN